MVSTYSFCPGNMRVASPEWVPAFSTCSLIAKLRISPRDATLSNSTYGNRGNAIQQSEGEDLTQQNRLRGN